jgi:hypothetical protein
VGLRLAVPVGLVKGFHNIASDVHGEAVEVIAGVEQPDVRRNESIEAG